ncbi:hypothetical protein PGT21_027080 [Puccinia graminis f. sp. tritici]|uniref:Uncharacterized protein n=1 Tax=Puccinia graminis f. sp. tritici TaxID=56615 RepID=A0A5B0PFV4_PUCGR|nr:hypothetical protein PGTUg99_006536 [Puccinia graminis f. sp. tritici]KAA1099973.1 hypothetical protein PGT21_027080 [Puccinia graminis f. sp. tritici]
MYVNVTLSKALQSSPQDRQSLSWAKTHNDDAPAYLHLPIPVSTRRPVQCSSADHDARSKRKNEKPIVSLMATGSLISWHSIILDFRFLLGSSGRLLRLLIHEFRRAVRDRQREGEIKVRE